jgi:uncharacterized sulfatase
MHKSLDSLQQEYNVTEAEFATTPREQVERSYRNFAKLAGEDPENYPDFKNW